jgi:hypothetical protein
LNFSSFAYVRRADLGGAEVVYYCPPDGIMRRRELSPMQVDEALPWPVPGVRCTGNSLVWNEARHSLTFAYQTLGLYGVAEYVNVRELARDESADNEKWITGSECLCPSVVLTRHS